MAWSPDGTKIGSGSSDKTLKIWNAKTGKCESTLTGHALHVSSVAWKNDGTKLASGSYDKTVRIWSVGSAGTFECESTLNVASLVLGISFAPSGDTLAVGCGNRKVLLVDAVTTVVKRSLNGHSDFVRAVTWSSDGTMLASGSEDKTIKLWDAQTGQVQSTLNGHT